MSAAVLFPELAAPSSAPLACRASRVARYRLCMVREASTPWDAELGAALGDPQLVARWLGPMLEGEPAELMGAAFLDVRNRLLGWSILYRGTIARAAVEPRAFLAAGLLQNAAGFIAFHNHPSGDPSPSAEDLALTRRLADAGDLVGLRLLDHLVIGEGGRFVSLRRRGGW